MDGVLTEASDVTRTSLDGITDADCLDDNTLKSPEQSDQLSDCSASTTDEGSSDSSSVNEANGVISASSDDAEGGNPLISVQLDDQHTAVQHETPNDAWEDCGSKNGLPTNTSISGNDVTEPEEDLSESANCNGTQVADDTGKSSQVIAFVLNNGKSVEFSHSIIDEFTLSNAIDSLTSFCEENNFEHLLPNESIVTEQHATISELKSQLDELAQCNKKVECHNLELRHELKQSVDKLNAHDDAAKRTISRLQQDHDMKLSEMNKRCAALEKDKQGAVMDYARREKELLDLRRKKDAAEQFARSAGKERDKATGQLKMLKVDLSKFKTTIDKKEAEVNTCKQETERLKEEINSQIIKSRWAQNKLKTEMDAHKETKEKCDKLMLELQQAKEETEQIRRNCQDMIKTYQESEEIKSNALDLELKEKLQLLTERKSQSDDLQSLLKQKSDELTSLKIKYKDLFEESSVLKSRVDCHDDERLKKEQVMNKYEGIMNEQKQKNAELMEKVRSLELLQEKLNETNRKNELLQQELIEALTTRDKALVDFERKEQREQELLEFTKRVSSKNSELAVQVEELTETLRQQTDELEHNKQSISVLKAEVKTLTSDKEVATSGGEKTRLELGAKLDEKEKTICQLLLQMEELKDDLRTQKRKNAASVKDLTRQLNQAKRRLETTDAVSTSSGRNSLHHSADGGSLGSRTSSTTSLDKICPSSSPELNCAAQNIVYEPEPIPETRVAGPSGADRQLLIERIVRLQQIHAKKNEKIDFQNEHIQQLVQELQKKQHLIQHYVMREEVGSLAPPKHGDSHVRPALTLQLSMEINQKMQSVLEDTILKNITLKENLEMLGKEVQRLCAQEKVS